MYHFDSVQVSPLYKSKKNYSFNVYAVSKFSLLEC